MGASTDLVSITPRTLLTSWDMEPVKDTEEGFVNGHHLKKIVMWEGIGRVTQNLNPGTKS